MSDSYLRGGKPRSVPDQDRDAYESAMQQQRALNAKQAAQLEAPQDQALDKEKLLGDRLFSQTEADSKIGHPSPWESMIPIWGSGREAMADAEDSNYFGAALNTGLAASDVAIVKSLAGGLLKGGLKLSGPYAWRSAPWQEAGARKWLGEKGFLAKGQPGHHWWLEQKSKAPDFLKNQPLFVKGMTDAVEHGRIHGPYTVDGVKLPQFNAFERFWRGTPDWWKALNISTPRHLGAAFGRASSGPPEGPDL